MILDWFKAHWCMRGNTWMAVIMGKEPMLFVIPYCRCANLSQPLHSFCFSFLHGNQVILSRNFALHDDRESRLLYLLPCGYRSMEHCRRNLKELYTIGMSLLSSPWCKMMNSCISWGPHQYPGYMLQNDRPFVGYIIIIPHEVLTISATKWCWSWYTRCHHNERLYSLLSGRTELGLSSKWVCSLSGCNIYIPPWTSFPTYDQIAQVSVPSTGQEGKFQGLDDACSKRSWLVGSCTSGYWE